MTLSALGFTDTSSVNDRVTGVPRARFLLLLRLPEPPSLVAPFGIAEEEVNPVCDDL